MKTDDTTEIPTEEVAYSTAHWVQRQYHNERIYWNFDLFVKVTLAIAGGLAFVVTRKIEGNLELTRDLAKLAGLLQVSAGAIITSNICFHVKAKIQRLSPRPQVLKQMWGWSETYLVAFVLFLSLVIAWVACFKIAPGLSQS